MNQKSGRSIVGLTMKRTRNLEKTRAHILEVAFREVFAKGFQGVSIDDIVKQTQLTKGAFYHHFPTKLELGYALVDDVIKPMILTRWIHPLTNYKSPIRGILSLLKKHIGESSAESLRLGCPLNNLVQEMAPIDGGFRRRLRSALNLWIDETETHIQRAQKNGQIRKEVQAREVAEFVVMAHEGFYGLMKGLGTKDSFHALYRSLERYFSTIIVRKKRPW